MDQQSAKIQRIHEYISDLDIKSQKERKRKSIILILSIFSFICVGVILYFALFNSNNNLDQKSDIYNFKGLNIQIVEDHFDQQKGNLMVKIPESDQLISLATKEDYWKLIDEYAIREIGAQKIFEEEFAEDTITNNEEIGEEGIETEATFTPSTLQGNFSVTGNRENGNSLVFQIQGFDPRIDYKVDFGNGIKRNNVSRRFGYRYPNSGRFTIILTGSFEGEEIVSARKFIRITNAQPQVETQTVAQQNQPPVVEGDPGTIEETENPPTTTPLTRDASSAKPQEVTSSDISEVLIDEVEDNISSQEESTTLNIEPTPSNTPDIKEDETATQVDDEAIEEEEGITQPLMVASVMPQYPGGQSAMLNFMNQKLSYPQAARDFHIEGSVYVQFVVNSNGVLSDFKVVRGLGYGCDQEALRIIKSMPTWQSGKQNGRNVPVIYTIPVTFKLVE